MGRPDGMEESSGWCGREGGQVGQATGWREVGWMSMRKGGQAGSWVDACVWIAEWAAARLGRRSICKLVDMQADWWICIYPDWWTSSWTSFVELVDKLVDKLVDMQADW
eukprot:6199503-Pleurochrysis_carterae.AAC.3